MAINSTKVGVCTCGILASAVTGLSYYCRSEIAISADRLASANMTRVRHTRSVDVLEEFR